MQRNPSAILPTVTVTVSGHAKNRYFQRVQKGRGVDIRAAIQADIARGRFLSHSRGVRQKWRKRFGLVRLSGYLDQLVVSADGLRIYVCCWTKDGLMVKTVLTPDTEPRIPSP